MKRTVGMVATGLLLVAGSVSGQATTKLPGAVQARVAEMAKTCRDVGAKPVDSPHLVTAVDITGDGVPDYVINEGEFQCDGAAALFAGSGGSQVSVYVGSPDGQATRGFEHGAFGAQLDREVKPARLYLGVGGVLCGQKVTPDMPRSDYTACRRPLQWNAAAHKMEFAPLSEIKPLK